MTLSSEFDTKIVVAIMTPILLSIGYAYRAHKENKKNRKVALYNLLEIWHRISVFYRRDFDDAFLEIVNEIRVQLPDESIANEEIEASKAHFTPVLLRCTREAALSDISDYNDKYNEVVNLISADDPIFAYRISSSSSTRKFLKFVDSYLGEALEPVELESVSGKHLSDVLKSHITEHAEIKSIGDLEHNICALSLKIGILTYLSCKLTIYRRKRSIHKMDRTSIKNLVKFVLVPAMKEFRRKSYEDNNV